MIKRIFKNNLNFIFSSISISINFFFSSILIIFLSLFDNLNLAAEIGLTLSFTLFLCQIFSANHRSLLYLKKYDNRISSIIHFRFLISILIIALSLFLILFLKFKNSFFLFVLSSLICLQWISEIFLTIKEKNKKYDFLNKILSVNIFFFSIILFSIFFNYIDLMKYSIIFLILSYLFIFKKEFKELKLNIKSLELSKNILKYSFKNYEIISSFSLNFSNLIWRFSIFLLAGKSVAGLLFGSYAICNFFWNNLLQYTGA